MWPLFHLSLPECEEITRRVLHFRVEIRSTTANPYLCLCTFFLTVLSLRRNQNYLLLYRKLTKWNNPCFFHLRKVQNKVMYLETINQMLFIILTRAQWHTSRFGDYLLSEICFRNLLWSYSQLASEKDMDLELIQSNLINLIQKSNSQPLRPKSILKWFPKTHYKVTFRKQLVVPELRGYTINLIFFKVCKRAFKKINGVFPFPLNKV